MVVIGDSKTKGVSSTGQSARYASLLNVGNVQVFAGNGDRTVEIVQTISRIADKKPSYALICLGRNDLASSVATLTWQGNYQKIVDTLTSRGVQVYHLLPIPESGLNQNSLRSWLLSTYPGRTIDTTGWVTATMVSSDNIHPNDFGHRQIAKNILSSGFFPVQAKATRQNFGDRILTRLSSSAITGSGTNNTLPKFSGTSGLANSAISDDGSRVTSSLPITISGSDAEKLVLTGTASPVLRFRNASNSDIAILQATSGFVRLYTYGNIPVVLASNNVSIFSGTSTGAEIGATGGFGYNAALFLRGFANSTSTYSLICSPNTVSSSTAPLAVTNGLGGQVGMGTNAPTARLTIAAGTASANTAPLKFTTGTNLTTPEAGAVEWDGSRLYVTQASGPTRRTLAFTSEISNTIYNGDGTLSANRTVTLGSNALTFETNTTTAASYSGVTFRTFSNDEQPNPYWTGQDQTGSPRLQALAYGTYNILWSINGNMGISASTRTMVWKTSGALNLPSVTPVSPASGDVWYSASNKLTYQESGATRSVASVEGDFVGSTSTITATTHTPGADYTVVYNANSNNITVTLGATLAEGHEYLFDCNNNATNTVTFNADTGSGYNLSVGGSSSTTQSSYTATAHAILSVTRRGTLIIIKP